MAATSIRHLRATMSGRRVSLDWQLTTGLPTPHAMLIEVGTSSGGSELGVIPVPSTLTSISGEVPPGTYFVRLRAVIDGSIALPSNEVRIVVP